jgi:hypothetical protein
MLERIFGPQKKGNGKLQNEKHRYLHLSLNIIRMGREFMFHEKQTISGIAKQMLASQEGLCFMELGFCYIHFILHMDELSSTCIISCGPKTHWPAFFLTYFTQN